MVPGPVASTQRDEIALARRTAQATASDAADRVERFRALLAGSLIGPREAVTTVSGGSARLLFALNDSADEIVASLESNLATRLDAVHGSERRGARATDVERGGRDWLTVFAADAVASWYEHQRADIEEGVAALDARLIADLRQELGVLRESATELEPAGPNRSTALTRGQAVRTSRSGVVARRRRSQATGCTWRPARPARALRLSGDRSQCRRPGQR